ncbi:MAG: cytochrome c [Anaerolineae bacterium]
MNEKKMPWLLVVGGGVLVGLLLVACSGLTLWRLVRPWSLDTAVPTAFRSNGEQIYFTATSQRRKPIVSDAGMGMMGAGMMTCANCHGPDGRGRRGWMMMRVFEAPDIRYESLISGEHGEGHGEEEAVPYNDEDIKRAITEGVEPDGERLDWPMPRWSMTDEDLDDLLEFLKTLH